MTAVLDGSHDTQQGWRTDSHANAEGGLLCCLHGVHCGWLQETAGSLQSLCWGSSAVGGIASAYFSGSLVQSYGSQAVFGLTAVFPLIVSASALLIDEHRVLAGPSGGDRGAADSDQAEQGSLLPHHQIAVKEEARREIQRQQWQRQRTGQPAMVAGGAAAGGASGARLVGGGQAAAHIAANPVCVFMAGKLLGLLNFLRTAASTTS